MDFLIIALMVLVSAFFSCMETAVFSLEDVDVMRLEKQGTRASRILLKHLKSKSKILSAILIGNNLMNIMVSAFTTTVAISFAEARQFNPEVVIGIFAFSLTLLVIVFGEIIPKSLAIHFNYRLALIGTPLLNLVYLALYPVCLFFDLVNRAIAKLFKSQKSPFTDDFLLRVLRRGAKEGNIDSHEKEFVENVMRLGDKTVSSIMTPRVSVFALDSKMPLKDAVEPLLKKNFSRIPVYEDSIDNIVGVVNLKMLTPHILAGEDQRPLKAFAKEPAFLYETQKIHQALEKLRKEQSHFAIVVDEFGGVYGIVTLEDMIEEIIGEIFDEKDVAFAAVSKTGENKWVMPGRIDIHLFNKETESELDASDEYETLQGLIMHILQKVPKSGEIARFDSFCFRIREMKGNEILSVEVEKERGDETSEENDEFGGED